jgi:protein MAK11
MPPVLAKKNLNRKDVGLSEYLSLQIVTGSYDRGILHGITASIPSHSLESPRPNLGRHESIGNNTDNAKRKEMLNFSDSFLFAAHSSSIRCLDISGPSETGKRILATGGSDERINLYSLSTNAPALSIPSNESAGTSPPLLVPFQPAALNSKNRSLGNLLHHDRAITRLRFPPNTNKLFSSSEDNNIAITRTRDWTLLSSIRAPIPKPVGRPSGDTAAPGEVPAGINDFAIHPSQKLMLSVGRGERCLRLWNLMTGKKAGVLNFDRDVLAQAGEGKYSSGEGRRVLWSEDGEAYVVVFERGAVVYGLDSKARAVIRASRSTKLHQVKFLPKLSHSGREMLAISTEDGRILLFDTRNSALDADDDTYKTAGLAVCPCIAQLGGRNAGVSGRIKDFEILTLPQPIEDLNSKASFLAITGCSDGVVRIWSVSKQELDQTNNANGASDSDMPQGQTPKQVGTLIGTLESGNRITCLGAFVMDGRPGAADGAEVEENETTNGIERDEDESENTNGIERNEDESEDESWGGIDG